MAPRFFGASAAAALLVVAIGCTQSSAPLSPSAALGGTDAAADGSNLKAPAPTLISPVGGTRIDSVRPLLVVTSVNARFTATPAFGYLFEVSTMGGQVVAQSPLLGAGVNNQTAYQLTSDLQLDTQYQWRARVELDGKVGPWSAFGQFLTIDYRGLVPRPPGGAWPTNGNAVVNYVAAAFPERLRPTSFDKRVADMEFLRDRIIEAGRCGGLDLARNLKRGIGPHSIDAIAWRTGGRVAVMDLASGYDENQLPLRLKWQEVDGPPGYDGSFNLLHPGC